MSNKLLSYSQPSLKGTINIPGDKSISHRAIMFGSLAKGTTVIENFLMGEDCLSTIGCFRQMGVSILVEDQKVTIEGKGFSELKEPTTILNVGNSGTTIRLLSGILSGVNGHFVLIGDDSIARRPMSRIVNPLRQMNATISGREDGKYTPLSISGSKLNGITYQMPVASAQVKSAILFAGLQAKGTTTIIEKEKSRDHTERMIAHFGGNITVQDKTITIEPQDDFIGTNVFVPGDISSAAFFLVAGAITKNSKITLKNIGLNPTRTGIIDVLRNMGASISISNEKLDYFEPYADITVETSNLKPTIIEKEIIPRLIDEIPIIALLATQVNGTTIIKDAHELKVKETNRIDTVVNELKKLGAAIEATEDGMIIHGPTPLKGAKVDSHKDHRIAMMLAIASLICEGEVCLENAEDIAVSYPTFFSDLENLLDA